MIDIEKSFNEEDKFNIVKLLNDLVDNWEKDLKSPGVIVGDGIRSMLKRDSRLLRRLAEVIND